MISVASASFSSFTTTSRSAWYPGVTAPCAMCSRARRRSVSMSERKAPLSDGTALMLSPLRHAAGRAGRGRRLRRRERLVALRLGFVLARRLLLALLVVAALLGDVVVGLGLRLGDLVLRVAGLVVARVELGLGDFLPAFRFLHADVLGVALH